MIISNVIKVEYKVVLSSLYALSKILLALSDNYATDFIVKYNQLMHHRKIYLNNQSPHIQADPNTKFLKNIANKLESNHPKKLQEKSA